MLTGVRYQGYVRHAYTKETSLRYQMAVTISTRSCISTDRRHECFDACNAMLESFSSEATGPDWQPAFTVQLALVLCNDGQLLQASPYYMHNQPALHGKKARHHVPALD